MRTTSRRTRPPRRRAKETIATTNLTVISSAPVRGTDPDLSADVELVKAALLYADTVEVLSPRQQLVRAVVEMTGTGDGRQLARLMSYLDDEQWRQLAPGVDPTRARQVVDLLETDLDRLRSATTPDSGQRASVERLAAVRQSMDVEMQKLRGRAVQLLVESGAAEIELALADRRVQYNALPLAPEEDAFQAAFADEVTRYLQDPQTLVLLDPATAALVRGLLDRGAVTPPPRVLANAGEALLGAGFLAKLPAFPQASMQQVLDLRRDLDAPLSRYRRQAAALREHLIVGPFDDTAAGEVQHLWRTEVAPALVDLQQGMADHALARELLRGLGADLGRFAKGTLVPGAGLTVAAASVTDVAAAVAVGLPAVAAPVVARAAQVYTDHRTAARAANLYYLYETDRRLQRS